MMNIDRAAICHIPLSNYAFVSTETRISIRIRCAKNNLKSCVLYYGDRAFNASPVLFQPMDMKKIASDEFYDYYDATFESPYTRVCYYFKLSTDEEWIYYYADQFVDYLPDLYIDGKIVEGRSEYYQYPFILRNEIADAPKWFKNASVYNIFPDSFASTKGTISCEPSQVKLPNGQISHSRNGGNLRGIIENIDYIYNMGFSCIYLNPIFVAGEWHKYDIIDYFNIDPCMGTNEEFSELVSKLHARGMKIIIDGVFNHCSWYFKAFDDVVKNGEASEYADWFYELKYPVRRPVQGELLDYACFAYEPKMPKLNTSNVKVQKYFAEVGKYWIEKYDIDGWRLDVANEIDRDFWRLFRRTITEVKKDVVMIGEVWENSQTWLRGDAFHSTMNYDFRKHCRDFFALDRIDSEGFANNISDMLLRYPTNISYAQLNLLDSHDVPRFLSLCDGNIDKWKLAFICLIMMPGVPSMFYGDEVCIEGVTESEYRTPMRWNETHNNSLCDFISRLNGIRKNYIDSTSGFEISIRKKNSGLFAFERKGIKGKLTIAVNNSEYVENLDIAGRQILISNNMENGRLLSYGYVVLLG